MTDDEPNAEFTDHMSVKHPVSPVVKIGSVVLVAWVIFTIIWLWVVF